MNPTNVVRNRAVKIIGMATAPLLAGAFGWAQLASSSASATSTNMPAGAFSVRSYGADPTGHKDSTDAVRKAIAAAQAKGGTQVVYFPAGTYRLDDRTGTVLGYTVKGHIPVEAEVFLSGRTSSVVNVLGAGASVTKVVEAVGTSNPDYPHLARGFDAFYFHESGFYFSGLTVDSQTYNAGDALDDYGSNSTIENSVFKGAQTSGPNSNPDVYAARVAMPCTSIPASNDGSPAGYTGPNFGSGNTATNLTVSGDGGGGSDDLDFSCQHGGTVSNITDTGWGLALYNDYGVNVENYSFTPGARPARPGFYVTDSSKITIDHFTSSGQGGIISGGTDGQVTFDVTVSNETANGVLGGLTIGGAQRTTISNSSLRTIRISPLWSHALKSAASGVKVTGSYVGSVVCAGKPAFSGGVMMSSSASISECP